MLNPLFSFVIMLCLIKTVLIYLYITAISILLSDLAMGSASTVTKFTKVSGKQMDFL